MASRFINLLLCLKSSSPHSSAASTSGVQTLIALHFIFLPRASKFIYLSHRHFVSVAQSVSNPPNYVKFENQSGICGRQSCALAIALTATLYLCHSGVPPNVTSLNAWCFFWCTHARTHTQTARGEYEGIVELNWELCWSKQHRCLYDVCVRPSFRHASCFRFGQN